MPLTESVGVSKKLGPPDCGSLSASCNVTVESHQTTAPTTDLQVPVEIVQECL